MDPTTTSCVSSSAPTRRFAAAWQILTSPVLLSGCVLEAHVRDGVVVLTGTVPRPVDASVVCSIIRQIPGVVQVVDRISTGADLEGPALTVPVAGG